METYTLMREIADSWVMLAMFSIFIGVVVWAFRPGSRPVHDHIANSIFRHEKKPAAEAVSTPAARQQTEEA